MRPRPASTPPAHSRNEPGGGTTDGFGADPFGGARRQRAGATAEVGSAPRVNDTEVTALRRALTLAGRGPAYGPNPRVGAVLLGADGTDLGEGWHEGAGTPHAEVAALADAAARGHDPRGATMLVTLEPCNHTGRTGPCAQALVEAGVARVVFSVADPNPAAAGGAAHLVGSGVDVVGGVLADEGRAVLGPWWDAVARGRPYVTVKVAATLDGRVAAADGSSRWITSATSREHAHALRAQVDAIAIGTTTALVDNPALTARTTRGLAAHQPLRVVVGHRDVPPGAALRGPGGELVQVRSHDPADVIAVLAQREVRHLLVEGGPTLAAAFLRAGQVDAVHAYIAPALLGAGPPAVGDLGISTIADALRLELTSTRLLGPDVLLTLRTAAPAPLEAPRTEP